MTLELSLILGTAFGLLTGAMAFVITSAEYRRHQMARLYLWKGALRTGAFACGVFMLATLAAGVLLKA